MREFTVGPNDAGQRLDRWLAKTLPLLPAPLAQKYIRLKRVKLNGKGAKRDTRLAKGDLLQLVHQRRVFRHPHRGERLSRPCSSPSWTSSTRMRTCSWSTNGRGWWSTPTRTEKVNTLITHIQAYLYQKKEWSPYEEHAFAPALCNRIDRNTGGIVIAAKNAETLRIMNQKIRDREVEKSLPLP